MIDSDYQSAYRGLNFKMDEQKLSAIRSALRGLNALSVEIEASAAISGDGFVIASVLES
jgi:hypothetical protein